MADTPEMLALAREIVAPNTKLPPDMVKAGMLDATEQMRVALVAIQRTTELAAKLADVSDGYNDVTGGRIARALRNFDHLKGATK